MELGMTQVTIGLGLFAGLMIAIGHTGAGIVLVAAAGSVVGLKRADAIRHDAR